MRTALGKRPRVVFYYAAAAGVILLMGNLSILFLVSDKQLSFALHQAILPVENVLAFVALFYAAYRSLRRSSRLALAWGILSLAQFSLVLGNVFWGIFQVTGSVNATYYALSDGFHLGFYPIFLVGVLLLPASPFTLGERVKNTLDLGIILLAAILGLWNFLLGPLVAANSQELTLSNIFTLAFPVGDLVLLGALMLLLYYGSKDVDLGPILLLIGGAVVLIVADCLFGYQSLAGSYQFGGLLDISWAVVYVLFGLAGVLHLVSLSPTRLAQATEGKRFGFQQKMNSWLFYFPFVWVAAAYVMLVASHYVPVPMEFSELAIGIGVLIMLVFVRQVILVNEGGQLYQHLQQVVEQMRLQAVRLRKTNEELQAEMAERKRIEEKLAHDALHDALTGLPNRVLFIDRLERAIEYTKRRTDSPFAVLFLDLDQFKIINDSLGHTAGDELLISVSHRLKMCLRSSDTAARFGGDEFVVLIENAQDIDAILKVVNRLQDELRLPFNLLGQRLFITASIGVVPSLEGYDQADEVLRDADIAMYRAKALGKARYEIFDTSLRVKAISRLELEKDLRHALEYGEFLLHYQPIMSLESDKVTGFEALIRWSHPQRGMLFPQEFIPVAEDSGLIVPIGQWVLYEAGRQMCQWQKKFLQEPPLVININISGKQFIQADFTDQVEQMLLTTGLDARSLRLEITESVLMDNPALANARLEKLRDLGIQLQIDDFGTGLSSLGYLQNFPIRTIKIDKSFVREMSESGGDFGLIKTILSMAHDLGMDAIAEGVETEEQLSELRQLQCEYVQGYLCSRPLDAASAGRFLKEK
jgi:diguanylate cyclase (GGDEF)-like protein